jgi:ankyrin
MAMTAAAAVRAASPLADAAMHNDPKAVRATLRQASDVNATQADGMTALHWAVHRDNLEIANMLLKAGADPGASNRTGATPMYLATVNANDAMIELLLDAGEDPNAVLAPTLETVLMLTAKTGNAAAVQLLLDRGAEVNARQVREFTPLMFAAAEGHAAAVKTLLENGADPNLVTVASTKPERRPAGGMSALILAARQGHVDTVRALLEGGADVNLTSADRTSALLIAVINGRYELANVLLEHGADPSLADTNGRAPLYAAIDLRNVQWSQAPAPKLPQADHLAMIETLVAAGADLNTQIRDQINHRGSFDMRWTELVGGTPFLRAAWNGDVQVMKLLLEHGADPRVQTDKGETALLLLTGAGWPLGQGHIRSDEEIVASLDLLVEDFGMDVNVATAEGITPLMCAVFKGTNNVIEYLVAHGAALDAVDNEGRSLLTWAAGVAANMGQPPRPQPASEKLIRKLMDEKGVTVAMLTAD